MFLFRSEFWTSKSESLAQVLVADFIKGIIIAALALFVMDYAKGLIELYDKRRALVAFQNAIIEKAILKLQSGYVERIPCTGSVAQFRGAGCLAGLETFRVEIDQQKQLAEGIKGEPDVGLERLGSAIDELIAAYGEQTTREDLMSLSTAAKEKLQMAIKELAQEIR